MKKHLFHIAFLFCLALFMPAISHACGSKATAAEKAACRKNRSAKLTTKTTSCKQCCSSINKHKNCQGGCGGKCDNGACKCFASGRGSAAMENAQIKTAEQIAGINNQLSQLGSANISPGFGFTWLPPKIS